jgi:hypothetical protein
VTAISRQLAIVVFGCYAYVVVIGITTASMISANKIADIFACNVFTGPIVYIVGCQLPLSLIGVLILKLDLSEVED